MGNDTIIWQKGVRVGVADLVRWPAYLHSVIRVVVLHIKAFAESLWVGTVCARRKVTLGFHRNAQPIMRLHGSVICQMNGNFVSFQNMCEFKRLDP